MKESIGRILVLNIIFNQSSLSLAAFDEREKNNFEKIFCVVCILALASALDVCVFVG